MPTTSRVVGNWEVGFWFGRHLGVPRVSAIFSTSAFPSTQSTFLNVFMDREVGYFYAFQCTRGLHNEEQDTMRFIQFTRDSTGTPELTTSQQPVSDPPSRGTCSAQVAELTSPFGCR